MKTNGPKDMTGLVFGKWTVVGRAGSAPSRLATWLCICRCGTSKTVEGAALRGGKTRGCANCAYGLPADLFWAKVEKSDGCWLWTGAKNNQGYGQITRNRKPKYAHRFSWELTNGPIPAGLFVCHRCDVPLCVRIEHLFLGSPLDNVRDMQAKGRIRHRALRGEASPHAKLTTVQVLEIRGATGTRSAIARRYGIARSNVHAIKTGRNWAHIPFETQAAQ